MSCVCQSEECKRVVWTVCYWRHLSTLKFMFRDCRGTRQTQDNNIQICWIQVGFGYKALWSLTSCWHVRSFTAGPQTEQHQNRTQTGSYLGCFSVSQSDFQTRPIRLKRTFWHHTLNIRGKILANWDWRFGCKMDHSADRYMTASTGWTQRRLLLIGGLDNHRLPVAPRLFIATEPLYTYIQATHQSRGEVYFLNGWLVTGMTWHHE